MIRFRQGDIVRDTSEALVNTVNCVGVMGRGVALAFKNAFPENYRAYADACRRSEVVPGRMFVFPTSQLTPPAYIINFPTKRHWRARSRIEDIVSGLDALVGEIDRLGIRSIAIPPLGSGLGGLNWEQVRPLIEQALSRLPEVDATVYEPGAQPSSLPETARHVPPAMSAARAVVVLAIERYLEAMLDPTVTLLELHKLLYFAQEAGQPLKLRFEEGHFGPYAGNLRFLLHEIDHHFVEVDLSHGDNPKAAISLLPSAMEDAARAVSGDDDTRSRLARVFELVSGWESPHGLELLATVHWVASKDDCGTVEDAVRKTYEWNERKRRFTERQIELAYRTLAHHGWLENVAAG